MFFSIRTNLIFIITALFSTTAIGSTTLEQLIHQALETYPSVLSKQASREAASSEKTAAKLRFFPNPSFNTQRNQVAYNGQQTASLPATNITISQPIFMGGGLIAGYDKADARLSAADFALLEAREDVSRRLITSYAEWLKSWFKIQALEENVRLHEKFVGMISRRYEQGVASGADKDLGVSRLHQAIADLETQKSIEQSMLTTISELAGQPVRRADLITRIPKKVKIPDKSEGIDRALVNSVTIQRFKFEGEAAEAESKEVRAQALPQLSFQAQRQIGNAYVPGAQGFDMYGLVVSYTPGGGISSIASSSAAADRAKAVKLGVESAKRELTDKLNAEYNEHDFSLLKKESLQRSVDLSNDISASYDRQYLVGRKSWLDLMNAVRERAQTRVQLADAEGSLIGSSYRLLVYVNGTQQFDSVPP